jgi:hypothetical protein
VGTRKQRFLETVADTSLNRHLSALLAMPSVLTSGEQFAAGISHYLWRQLAAAVLRRNPFVVTFVIAGTCGLRVNRMNRCKR